MRTSREEWAKGVTRWSDGGLTAKSSRRSSGSTRGLGGSREQGQCREAAAAKRSAAKGKTLPLTELSAVVAKYSFHSLFREVRGQVVERRSALDRGARERNREGSGARRSVARTLLRGRSGLGWLLWSSPAVAPRQQLLR